MKRCVLVLAIVAAVAFAWVGGGIFAQEVDAPHASSGRRLLTRLVLLAASPTGHDVVQESLRVLTLRDL